MQNNKKQNLIRNKCFSGGKGKLWSDYMGTIKIKDCYEAIIFFTKFCYCGWSLGIHRAQV